MKKLFSFKFDSTRVALLSVLKIIGLSFAGLLLLGLVLAPFVENEKETVAEETQDSTAEQVDANDEQSANGNTASPPTNNNAEASNESTTDSQPRPTGSEQDNASDNAANEESLYEVVKVVDGDTIDVSINGETERIRIIGLDTPETVDPRQTVECFGLEASAKAKELLLNEQVRLEADSTQGERDTYGRLLRYVFLADGRNYSLEMIKQGYGHEYTYNVPHKYQQEFQQAENEAKDAQRGLWASTACIDSVPDSSSEEESESQGIQGGIDDARDRLEELLDTYDRGDCHSAYEPCLSVVEDLNCSDVQGPITVKDPAIDPYQLDRDGDGTGCEP